VGRQPGNVDVDFVSILVCTRNRPDSLDRTVRSLLASDGRLFELIVIDQSDGPVFAQALSGFRGDARLRHVHSTARGKGAALNEGLKLARGEIVVCTDDDCEAPPDWAQEMARTLATQPSAAVLFCSVTASPCDWSTGYIPAYEIVRPRLLTSLLATCAGHGMGAGMAVRRAAVLSLGGFDEEVGPGARFPSGDDWDICHRALLSGWAVYEAAHLSILHHGFRTLEQGRQHAHRDWLAIGAVCAKPIRAGYLSALALPAWYFSIHALWPPLRDVLRIRRPRGWSRIAGFVDGFTQGMRTPVRKPGLLFERSSPAAGSMSPGTNGSEPARDSTNG
jgi:glycosyltransferase involved in cell wall biosynthesis